MRAKGTVKFIFDKMLKKYYIDKGFNDYKFVFVPSCGSYLILSIEGKRFEVTLW